MSILNEAFRLTPLGPQAWRGFADPRNEGGSGIFGGWTAPVLLKSILDDGRHHGQQARLWSRSGALLTTTEQMCWFH